METFFQPLSFHATQIKIDSRQGISDFMGNICSGPSKGSHFIINGNHSLKILCKGNIKHDKQN